MRKKLVKEMKRATRHLGPPLPRAEEPLSMTLSGYAADVVVLLASRHQNPRLPGDDRHDGSEVVVS